MLPGPHVTRFAPSPTGALHLGNYFGMMSKMIAYQEHEELFCFIANYHALTTIRDPR